jgi:hypothetical protein
MTLMCEGTGLRSCRRPPSPVVGVVLGCAMALGGLLSASSCIPDLDALDANFLDAGAPETGLETGLETGPETGPPPCTKNSECPGMACVAGACFATCTDGVKDQDEADVDCGGVCAQAGLDGGAGTPQRCDTSHGCTVANDCQSFLCASGSCAPEEMIPVTSVIDDNASGTGRLPTVGNRVGSWFEYDDGTAGAMVVPKANQLPSLIPGGGPGGNRYGQHTAGMGFTTWGCGIGFDLNNPGGSATMKSSYDGSGYSGIEFWARSDDPGTVEFEVIDSDTNQYGDAGCTPTAPCGPFSAPIALTKQWTLYKILYADLKQQRYGMQFQSFNPTQIISIQFQMPANVTFDYWIGEIAFF